MKNVKKRKEKRNLQKGEMGPAMCAWLKARVADCLTNLDLVHLKLRVTIEHSFLEAGKVERSELQQGAWCLGSVA